MYKRQELGPEAARFHQDLQPAVEASGADLVFCCGGNMKPVSYTHLRAHETVLDLVCRLLLEKKKNNASKKTLN